MKQTLLLISFATVAIVVLAACNAPPTVGPISLVESRYTALGANPKPDQPTTSDLADLQAAQNGTLNKPALVEFYSDT